MFCVSVRTVTIQCSLEDILHSLSLRWFQTTNVFQNGIRLTRNVFKSGIRLTRNVRDKADTSGIRLWYDVFLNRIRLTTNVFQSGTRLSVKRGGSCKHSSLVSSRVMTSDSRHSPSSLKPRSPSYRCVTVYGRRWSVSVVVHHEYCVVTYSCTLYISCQR